MLKLCLISPQREQMLAAQEMFRDANKVTKPEKALILGFMAGARGIILQYCETDYINNSRAENMSTGRGGGIQTAPLPISTQFY